MTLKRGNKAFGEEFEGAGLKLKEIGPRMKKGNQLSSSGVEPMKTVEGPPPLKKDFARETLESFEPSSNRHEEFEFEFEFDEYNSDHSNGIEALPLDCLNLDWSELITTQLLSSKNIGVNPQAPRIPRLPTPTWEELGGEVDSYMMFGSLPDICNYGDTGTKDGNLITHKSETNISCSVEVILNHDSRQTVSRN